MAAVERIWTSQASQFHSTIETSYALPIMPQITTDVPQACHRHIWIVAGTSCCGKSTVAEKLAEHLGCPKFIEGDDYHTAENKAKMKEGIPLTDADRAPWLDSLRDLALNRLEQAERTLPTSKNVVVTCSALKREYRQVFRKAAEHDPTVSVHFIFLTAPPDVLVARIRSRKGHFFSGEEMIRSQLSTLEMPTQEESDMDVINIDCTSDAMTVEAEIFAQVKLALMKDYSSIDRACA